MKNRCCEIFIHQPHSFHISRSSIEDDYFQVNQLREKYSLK